MSRSRKSQSEHDAKVLTIARRFEKQGFNVQADIAGYPKPPTINGYRPDVVAKDGWDRKIVEVETPESVTSTRDLAQQQAFRQAANRSEHTTFRRVVTG